VAVFLLPSPPPIRSTPPALTELSGEDVMFTSRLEISAGDWRTVTGSDAAEQSVRREALASPGSLLRRPEWGMGVVNTVFASATRSLIDVMVTRVRRRMLLNPRVGRFVGADVVRLANKHGLGLSINYEPVGARRSVFTVLSGRR
jgi:hypothetical protein